MIVRFLPSGRSFKWLATYLTHDADKAQTAERVAWTHTVNLAHDDVPSAVHSMFNTFRDRDMLKAESGIGHGGAKLEKPVKHFSLNWHPDEKPTREEMIAATESFLREMGWQDHQCLLVAHTDTGHRHVHVMLNAVHPEKGIRLNDAFERRRAQNWALAYERARGKVYCEERLKPVAEREPSPPRPVWQKLRELQPQLTARQEPEIEDPADWRAGRSDWRAREWREIRRFQKEERLGFFAEGKRVYREVRYAAYQDVRGAYRREWREYYALKRAGAAPAVMTALRADLVARQTTTVEQLCRTAAGALRKERDTVYRRLLDRQMADREQLAERQERGLTSPHLWAAAQSPNALPGTSAGQEKGKGSLAPANPSHGSGFHWTHRGGLAPQQRSAARWLDRAVERLSRAGPERHPAPANKLAEARERIRRKEPSKTRPGIAMATEPDG